MRDFLKDKTIRKILILAILIRLLMMPFLYHPDIKTYNFQASFLSQGVINIYPYLLNHRSELPFKEEFVYFPLTYFAVGSYQILISPLLGPNFHNFLFNASSTVTTQAETYRYLFLLKLPYLVLDLVIAFLLTNLFTNFRDKKRVFTIWLLNPFTIIILYVFSNVDIWPVLLTVLSLIFARRRQLVLSALCLGIAAGFKAYPLIFVPFLLLHSDKWKQRLWMMASSIGVFVLILFPFNSKALIDSAVSSGLTSRILDAGIGLGFGENIILSIFLLSAFFFFLMEKGRKIDLAVVYTVVLLILYSFMHFHIQWLLWVMPFAALILSEKEHHSTSFLILIILAMLIPFLYDDKFMNVSLFSAISPFYSTLPTPNKLISPTYSPEVIMSLLHTVMVALGLIVSFKLVKEEL